MYFIHTANCVPLHFLVFKKKIIVYVSTEGSISHYFPYSFDFLPAVI